MILSDLISFLKSVDAKPRKSLSQNFLVDPSTLKKIVDLADVQPGEAILEIGPGPGALTGALLAKGAKVYAVEMDPVFAEALERLQNGNLNVFQGDILQFPIERLPKNIKVVANLPYHITTPILEKLFTHSFSSITIMVQKEVAARMAAAPGSKVFGSLSVFVQFYSKFGGSFTVPPASFYPQPKVDSTVIKLNATTPPDVNRENFFGLVHKAFQQRRKMITSSLDLPKDAVRNGLVLVGARPDARPETLSLDQWAALTKQLSHLLLQSKE